MKPLLGPEGRDAIVALALRPGVLLAFDFDGTLAPLVDRPEAAVLPQALRGLLRRAAQHWPVAVLSGRSLEDLRRRIGDEGWHLVGNHGMEDPAATDAEPWHLALAPVRQRLAGHGRALRDAGVRVEDKELSIALHFRATAGPSTMPALEAALAGLGQEIRVGKGRQVVNLTPAGAPDKGTALRRLARRLQASAGLYIGDDENDEPAFNAAGTGWLTVRIGNSAPPSAARFQLPDQAQVATLLEILLDCRLRTPSR